MKNLTLFILIVFFCIISFLAVAQEQIPGPNDWIRQHNGIPIVGSMHWHWLRDNPDAVKDMKTAGVDVLRFHVEDVNHIITLKDTLQGYGFQFIPGSVLTQNYIHYYTDAKYSEWEAEGNENYGANLIFYDENTMEDSVMVVRGSGGDKYLKLLPSAAAYQDTTLIWGPYYRQDIKYFTSLDGIYRDVEYNAAYDMKLEWNLPTADTTAYYNPSIPICRVQVTQSYALTTQTLGCTYPIVDSILTLEKFLELNQWKKFSFRYKLDNDSCSSAPRTGSPQPMTDYMSDFRMLADETPIRQDRQYIQFKVIWYGNPNFLLSIDKVTIYDERGSDLKFQAFPTTQIYTQDNLLNNDYDYITGYIGFDEPTSIDIAEPIRIVKGILDSKSNRERPLWLPWMGFWDAAFESRNNKFGAMSLNPWAEFNKRIGLANIIQDAYLYDLPCNDSVVSLYPDLCAGDWRVTNIQRMVDFQYKQASKLDPYWGASIQCGEDSPPYGNSYQRNIASYEFLYNINLALMYGAKFIDLYTYFARGEPDADPCILCNAIVNWTGEIGNDIKTDKYFTLKDTINPRLDGLFGKTLKTLTPTLDSLNINPSVNYDLNIGIIKKIKLDYGNLTEAMPSFIDLGFFNKEGYEPNRFFMIINRYYSDSLLNKFKIEFRNLSGFYNWSLMNYVDSSNTTIIANESGFVTSPQFQINSGDAILYSIFPVAEFGGKLLVSEIVGDGMTLTGDMSIENGATLSVYETYYAKANIIVKAGGRIDNYENGKIIFDPGKQLIIEGTAQINGTAVNRLSLEFSTETLEGIVVKPNAALYLNYCDVKNVKTAISAEPGSGQINISNVNFTNFSKAGVLLLGYQGDGPITPPPPTISNCNFFGSPVGVSVSNYNEILIQANTFNNCNITIASVTSAYLQGNSLNGGSSKIFAGIFMDNSGGYIRCNSITNFLSGAHLGNSSPDIGDNTIHHNIYHGLYIGSGSIPNLFARLISGQPYTYYGASGYNRIYENGMGYDPNNLLDNDGSEIYFSLSSALLGTVKRPGCNLIADDRQSTPTMSTLLLMNGTLNGDQQLYAQNNVWGTTTPTTNRFGNLSVVFSPYYSEPCLLPEGSGGSTELVTKTSTGIVVDTLYPAEGLPEDVSTLEASYSLADKHILLGEVEQAKPIYEQIVQGNYTSEEKLPAYNKLYTIANLTGADETYFNNLQNTFNDIASIETDSLLKKIYNQNAIKCDVSKQEYLTAISKFDNIIQQNPNSEEAVYAEIDIITTALNLDTTNSQLGKMGGGKYLVKGTSDYLTKLNNILQNKFGINSEEKEQIIPKEYSLYQNYPNPFNPTTTIKFDLPKDGLTTLEIFDILGRRITTLINENRSAGSYEQVFNASSLASGVYVYKLQAGDYINSKKMILLK